MLLIYSSETCDYAFVLHSIHLLHFLPYAYGHEEAIHETAGVPRRDLLEERHAADVDVVT